jgi:acetyl-CoA carboxylase carboxyltransferase component
VCDYPLDPEDGFGFERIGEIFDDASNPGRKRPFAMRSVMNALIDQDGGSLERWRSMVGAETAICWDAHLGGIPVTLLGIESHTIPREGYRSFDGPEAWTGGTLFPLSSKKVARALNAASGVRPVVVLANLSGFDGSPESMRKLQLEYGAEIARAVVNFKGPLLFMVVSRYHGGAYVVFSQELNDGLRAMALTGSYASVIGGGPAAAVVFTREVRARSQADPRVVAAEARVRRERSRQAREALEETQAEVRLEAQAELAAEFDRIHSVERARDVGSLDRIFAPARMRAELIGWLEQDA